MPWILPSRTIADLSRLISFRDTKANIQADSASLEETKLALATDTGELGIHTNGSWFWIGGESGAINNHDHSGDAGDGGTFDAANLGSGAATDGYVLTADGSGGSAFEVLPASVDADAIHDNVANEIHVVASKTTPVDADDLLIEDSAASYGKKRLTWANLKATIKTYSDTLYAITGHTHTTVPNHDHSGDAGDGSTFDAANLTSGASTDGQVLTSDGAGGSAFETLPADNDLNAIHDNVVNEIHVLTSKDTPVDADDLLVEDSAASYGKKRLTWANIKITLKTYFDTLYAVTAKGVTNGDSHDHSGGDGATIVLTNLSSGAAADGQVPTANGSGGIVWEAVVPILTVADTTDVSNPPTQAEIITALGAVSEGKMGMLVDSSSIDRQYLCLSDGISWLYLPIVKAV